MPLAITGDRSSLQFQAIWLFPFRKRSVCWSNYFLLWRTHCGYLLWPWCLSQRLFWLVKSNLDLFFPNPFSLMADNGTERDPTQYDPRWQAIEEAHFDWRCIVCCIVALSPGHLEHQHIPGTDSIYFDLDNTPWVKCDKCHTPFHLQCATWEPQSVIRNKRFLCTFFLCRQF